MHLIFVQSLLNIILQVLIYLIYAPEFFRVNNIRPTFFDFSNFIFYIVAVNIILRIVISIPIVRYIQRKNDQYAVAGMAFLESLFVIFSTVDCLAYIDQGIHLYDSIVIRTLSNPNFLREVHLSAISFATLGVIWSLFIFMQVYLWRVLRGKRIFQTHFKKLVLVNITLGTLAIIAGTYSTVKYIPTLGESASLFPFYSIFQIDLKADNEIAEFKVKYNYPTSPKLSAKNNIYLIVTESLRSDVVNPTYTPEFFEFIKNKNCLESEYHYSGGHTTEYGVFTALYGLYGFHYNEFLKNKLPSYGVKSLKDNGYKIEGLSASQLTTWMGAGFMFESFDQYAEFKSEPVYLDDQKMVDQAIELTTYNNHKQNPLFLFMFFNSTHHSYHYPPEYSKYTPALGQNFNQFKSGRDDPGHKQKVYNRYRNSVGWVDHNLGRFLRHLDQLPNEDGYVLLTGDHGEEFWEEGLLGHSRTNYINPRVRVPFFLCSLKDTKNPQVTKIKLSSHVDIFPTILSLLGAKQNLDQFNGKNLYDPDLSAKRPYIVITAPQFPYEKTKMALITEDDKYWLKNNTRKLDDLNLVRQAGLNDEKGHNNHDALGSLLGKFSSEANRFMAPK